MLLAPFQAGLVPVHAKPQPVLVTGRYLTRPQHASHAALVPEQNVSIVIAHTALDEQADVRHHLTRLPHEGVARVVLREAKDETAAPYGLYEVDRILHGRGHRLVTDHIDAPAEKGAGDGVVAVVRRDNADDLDAIGPPGF